MLAIHQIGNFGWFSERKTTGKYGSVLSALKAHISYVEGKAVAVFNSANKILEKAKEELKRRWDSRVALKFFIAVPRDWGSGKALKNVVAFVSKELGVPAENIFAFYHSHPRNPHVHLLIYPRDAKGKKLRISRRKLKEFHQAWDKFLTELGYVIKRYKDLEKEFGLQDEELQLPVIPIGFLKKDEELAELYEAFISIRNFIAQELDKAQTFMNDAEEIKNSEVEPQSGFKPLEIFRKFLGADKFSEEQKKQIEAQIKALGLNAEDKIAVVLTGENKKPLQRVLKVEKLLSDKFLAFLKAKNSEGYNVYITVNKLKPTARRRTKADFEEEQKYIYLDIDGDKLGVDGLTLLKRIVEEQKLPTPTLVVRTSKKNYQAVWILSETKPVYQLEAIMKRLANIYRLDHTQDVARVFRLAGFFNRKKGKGNFVYIDKTSSFKNVAFEPFKKLLPTLSEIENKKSELKPKFEQNIQFFAYTKLLDEYLKALREIFKNELFGKQIIANYLKLAEQVKKGYKSFKSASEFELALLHIIKKALPTEWSKEEKQKFLEEKFRQVLEIARPQKLARNKRYVAITVSKVIKEFPEPRQRLSRVNFEIRKAQEVAQALQELGIASEVRSFIETYLVSKGYTKEKARELPLKALILFYAKSESLNIDELVEYFKKSAKSNFPPIRPKKDFGPSL